MPDKFIHVLILFIRILPGVSALSPTHSKLSCWEDQRQACRGGCQGFEGLGFSGSGFVVSWSTRFLCEEPVLSTVDP